MKFGRKSQCASFEAFEKFCLDEISIFDCNKAEERSRNQAKSYLWHSLRYGRVTASRLYEAAHCITDNGSLCESILGARKVKDTVAMRRGRNLEKEVLKEVLGNENLSCGIFILPELPFFGASPDAITDEFVVEVKCPMKEENVCKYLKNGVIGKKFEAQILLQMKLTGRKKGLFCVASPNFEENHHVDKVFVEYNENVLNDIMEQAKRFWLKNIYPILINYQTVFLIIMFRW